MLFRSFQNACGGESPRHTGAEIENAVIEARLAAVNKGEANGIPSIDMLCSKLSRMRVLADDKTVIDEFTAAAAAYTSAALPKIRTPQAKNRNRRVGADAAETN